MGLLEQRGLNNCYNIICCFLISNELFRFNIQKKRSNGGLEMVQNELTLNAGTRTLDSLFPFKH